MIKKILLGLVLVVVVAATGLAGFAWYSLQPKSNPLSLPEGLTALSAPAGERLLVEADAKADYALLSTNHQSQELISYCGVASSVTVLNALGMTLNQDSFFDIEADNTKPKFGVMFGGMTLAELAELLAAHGGVVDVRYGDDIDVENFREVVRTNLGTTGDFLLVNYQREVLGQRRVGHISPVAAFDEVSDSVLILDTASYNYPPTWVPLSQLHAAMRAVDSSSGRARGFVQVSAGPM